MGSEMCIRDRGGEGVRREGCSEAATYDQGLSFRAFAFVSDARSWPFSRLLHDDGVIDGIVV